MFSEWQQLKEKMMVEWQQLKEKTMAQREWENYAKEEGRQKWMPMIQLQAQKLTKQDSKLRVFAR